MGIIRTDSVPISDLDEQLAGHLPRSLPDGFGLVDAWGAGDGFQGTAIWTDERCRIVRLSLSAFQGWVGHEGPRVGTWTVTGNASRACFNSVLGTARCLEYRANVDEGQLWVQMMGLDRDEGDTIVGSIST
jgi:hypothetical protein